MPESNDLQQLSRQFTVYMYETVNMLSKIGYNATRFLHMLNNKKDGPSVATRLILGDASDGLWRLKELNRLDLSVEMAVLLPRFEELFDELVRESARFKLDQMGFKLEAHLRSLKISRQKFLLD
jgi:hypothetical protein